MGIQFSWSGKEHAQQITEEILEQSLQVKLVEKHGVAVHNQLIQGNNLFVAGALLQQLRGQIDLIYIDPPFAAGLDFRARIRIDGKQHRVPAYSDKWAGGIDGYLSMLYPRIQLFHQLLSANGSIVVHCDWRVVHL